MKPWNCLQETSLKVLKWSLLSTLKHSGEYNNKNHTLQVYHVIKPILYYY